MSSFDEEEGADFRTTQSAMTLKQSQFIENQFAVKPQASWRKPEDKNAV